MTDNSVPNTVLKPCPNPECGSHNLEVVGAWQGNYYVACRDMGCMLTGPVSLTAAGAVLTWNNLPRQTEGDA